MGKSVLICLHTIFSPHGKSPLHLWSQGGWILFSVMAPTDAKKIIWLHSLPSFPPALSTECIYVSKTEVRSNTVNSLLTDTSIRWTPFLKWTPKVCACLSLPPLFTLHNMDISVRLRHLAVPKVSVIEVVVQAYYFLCSALILYPNLLFTKGKARSAQIWFVHMIAWNPQFWDVINNKFDKAVKFSLTRRVDTFFYDSTN